MPYGGIEIKERCSPNDSLRMVGIRVVRKRNNLAIFNFVYMSYEVAVT